MKQARLRPPPSPPLSPSPLPPPTCPHLPLRRRRIRVHLPSCFMAAKVSPRNHAPNALFPSPPPSPHAPSAQTRLTFRVPLPWYCMAANASPRVCSRPGAGTPGAQSGFFFSPTSRGATTAASHSLLVAVADHCCCAPATVVQTQGEKKAAKAVGCTRRVSIGRGKFTGVSYPIDRVGSA